MKPTVQLDAEKEGLIVQLLHEALELLELVAEQLPRRGTGYYVQSLFLVLRQMGYFFIENSSPLKSQVGTLSRDEADIGNRIKTVRNAIGHRESRDNFASPNLKLVGAMIFKDSDAEIQYGETKLRLLGEIVSIHRRYRALFRAAPELVGLSRHPMWKIEDRRLATAEAVLTDKLSKPYELLRLRTT